MEVTYVQQAYNKIASSFSSTRYRPWSCVERFLSGIESTSKVADIGCGNGKNMQYRTKCEFKGCDFSQSLVDICKEKGLNVVFGDILNIPFEDKTFDHTICVAVLHHLFGKKNQCQAISELKRITKKNGKIFILVWAFEQEASSKRQFTRQDNMIPWKDKKQNIIAWRYYHLFRKNEFFELLENEEVEIFFERGNWGAVLHNK